MALINFHSTSELTVSAWKDITQFILKKSVLEIGDEVIKFPENTGDDIVYVESRVGGGAFGFTYNASVGRGECDDIRQEVDLLIKIARQFQVELLASDEDANPFTFIHITPDGHAGVVGVEPEAYNEKDELTIEMEYHYFFGGVCTVLPLSNEQTRTLESLISPLLTNFELRKLSVTEMNNSFTRERGHFGLETFEQHQYVLGLPGCTWLSKDERSVLLESVAHDFHKLTGVTLLIFPANSGKVENIPGGSDSEDFCLRISQRGSEKIIYKPRRLRW